ncbi:MAG: hypothetical protein KAS21_00085 [Candidatus Aminicenantes bacterium]|nr:hypothetical protein [Candidatus Aminicenantes bacterium]MCK5003453.1 hypothetical protein [Candidatus Aminicenantes bacterium]
MKEHLEEIMNPPWKRVRFWITAIFFVILISYLIYFKFILIDRDLTAEELKSSVEFFNISSQWIEKEKIEDEDFKGIVMVPQVSFQIRNNSEKKMKNIYILGVFRKLYVGKAMGEGFKIVMKKAVLPGNVSEKIIINSTFGYRATSKENFNSGSAEWGKSLVELYIKSRRSKLFFIKSFYIRQIIEGMMKEVLIK